MFTRIELFIFVQSFEFSLVTKSLFLMDIALPSRLAVTFIFPIGARLYEAFCYRVMTGAAGAVR
jgi:hypothetical protein